MRRWTIREARKRAGLTQEKLAAKTRIRQGVISNLETGKILNPGFSTVLKLAKALEIAPEQLVFGSESQEAAR